MRTPTTDSEGDKLTATVGGSETRVPEKKLYSRRSAVRFTLAGRTWLYYGTYP